MNWRKAVAKVAPALGLALGGALGGMATQAVLGAFGVDADEPDVDGLLDAAVGGASAEQWAALKRAEQDFKVRLRELGIDETAIHAEDRASARARETAVGGWANSTLAAVVVVGFLLLAGWAVSGRLDGLTDMEIALVGTIFGAVSAKVDQIMSYYFGSSKGSARKTEILGRGLG